MKTHILFLMLFGITMAFGQPLYKQKMYDPSVNFYDAVKEAETYFETHPKGKGSGWKGYQRWKISNEYKYYPSGNRSNINPYFATDAYQSFQNHILTESSVFTNGWRDLGPYSANNITVHSSAGIGRVESFWVNPSNNQHIYMASRSGGFWRTMDEGATWENTTDSLIASGVNIIAVNPNNPDSILIHTQTGVNNTSFGVYRSTNGGTTWSQTNFNPTNLSWGGLGSNAQVLKMVYHPTISGLVFIGTTEGFYKSSDDLATWTLILPNSAVSDIEFHPTDPNILYVYDGEMTALNQNVILISTNQGTTFTQSPTLTGNNNAPGFISTTPNCPNCVFVASHNGVWRSINNGSSFSFLSNPVEGCFGFAVSDLNQNNMIYGLVDIEASTNGGISFTQVTAWANMNPDSSYVHADLRTAECVNGVFYGGTDGYLVKSTNNGLTWTRLNDGTGIRENYTLGTSQSDWSVSICGSQDNGTSILNANGWIEWYGGDGGEGVIQPLNPDWIIGSYQFGNRFRAKDGGQTLQGIGTPANGVFIAPFLIDPMDHMRVLHFSYNVYASEEFGGGWKLLGNPNINAVHVAAIAENNSSILAVSSGSNIRLTQDGGTTWSAINTGLPTYLITDIAFDPNDDSTLIVTYGHYQNDNQKIYISHNLGTTWTNITQNLGDMPIRTVVIDHTPDANIYVGGEIGVFYKPINGTNWSLYDTNLPNVTVRDLEIQYATNTIKAATWGRGLWENSLAGRKDYPMILTTEITDPPTDMTPFMNVDQYVNSVISYNGTLSNVFVKWSVDDISLNNSIQMINTVDSTWESQTPIPGNYLGGTKIYFKVYAIGANNDTTESYRFMYTIQDNSACNSAGSMDFKNGITLVNFGSINKSTGKPQAYNDYTATDSTILLANQTYDLSVNLDTDGQAQMYARAWIDWNQNGDLDDPGEAYYLGWSYNTSNGVTSGSPYTISVPSNALTGKTLMRISGKYSSYAAPCEVGFYGEVEDYSVIISGCAASASSITVSACDSYISPSTNYIYTSSGTYQDTLIKPNGCDSLISINVTIESSSQTSIAPTVCDSYTVPSGDETYTISGVYQDTIMAMNGCDSVISIDLTIISETVGNITTTACDSFASPSGKYVYTTTGIYQDTILNMAGCDSLLSIDITIGNTSSGSLAVTACDSYTSPSGKYVYTATGTYQDTILNAAGCDSLLSIDLTIGTLTSSNLAVSACDSYLSPSGGNLYLTSGIYQDTIANQLGCDSVITIDLTIPVIDTMLRATNDSLIANEANGTYQWIDCQTNSELVGEINQFLIPVTNGTYAAIITIGDCRDTTACFSMESVGIDHELFRNNVKIYPNPSPGRFTIELGAVHQNIKLEITDIRGRNVLTQSTEDTDLMNVVLDQPKGIYLIHLLADGKRAVFKLVRE